MICSATKRNGDPCKASVTAGHDVCKAHAAIRNSTSAEKVFGACGTVPLPQIDTRDTTADASERPSGRVAGYQAKSFVRQSNSSFKGVRSGYGRHSC